MPGSSNNSGSARPPVDGATDTAPRTRGDGTPMRAGAAGASRRALIVDPERTMARAHRDALSASGWQCELAGGVASAIQALERQSFEAIVVGLHKRQVANDLLETLTARPPERRGFKRLIGVRFEDDTPRMFIGLAAVLTKPTPPAALSAVLESTALSEASLPPTASATDRWNAAPRLSLPEVAMLVETQSLGRENDTLQRMAKVVRKALRADAAVILTDTPRLAYVASDKPEVDGLIAARMQEAAAIGAPTVTGALVTEDDGDYEQAFETLLAISTEGAANQPRVIVGVAYRGARTQTEALRPVLSALGRRIAEERAFQGVQDRMAAELDAVRDIGGLDPMLGVWNRGTLGRLLDMMETACRRTDEPLAVAVLNVVGMTRINEVHGHREGDALLRHVAEVAVYVVRGSDIVARYSGDDLAVVFHGATASQAVDVVERIRHTVASQPLRTDDGHDIHIATTAGVTALGGPDDTGERALARAAAAAARGDDSKSIVTAFFDAEKVDSGVVSVRRTLDGITFGGSYRVLHEIGAGGGGGVFRGEDLGLRRPVAIKVLRSEQSQNEELVERFRAEAATLAALRHPNLVQVYAFGLEDGHAYFVMELVEGESLFDAIVRSRKEHRPIPLERITMVLDQISSALRTLHRAGIIHRDVKPANVLIDPFRDRAVLVDVGIASRHGERANLAGTPGYMAPEAATSADLNASADVYGLAVTLYELLTLRLPWPVDEDPLRTIHNQRTIAPTPPSEINPALAPLDESLLTAMHVEPSKRWGSVDVFGTALKSAIAKLGPLTQIEQVAPLSTEPVPDSADLPEPEIGEIAHAPTVVWRAPDEQEANTRGVVFRALPRVIGARNTASWRLELGTQQPRLAEALSPATLPLGWLPTRLLVELLTHPPEAYPRGDTLGRDLGRACVRATFRRFFPASAVTLAPGGTLNALPTIWPRYHSWGTVRVVPHMTDKMTVLIQGTPKSPCLCDWTVGTLEQLVLLSGGDSVVVQHDRCEAKGAHECAFDVTWQWDPSSNRSWRPNT